MQKYVALLRGINISGKNKVLMSELKAGFAELGFSNVITYINSGNVIFCSDMENIADITYKIKLMIENEFNLDIPVYIIKSEELEEILHNAPVWWGGDNKDIYDNLIFIMPPAVCEDVLCEIGETKKEYEKIHNYNNVIFWSFIRKDYRKTNWWAKTATSTISNKITIRTANTVKKLVGLCNK